MNNNSTISHKFTINDLVIKSSPHRHQSQDTPSATKDTRDTTTDTSDTISVGVVVNACGPWGGKLVDAFATKIENSYGKAITALPVKARKRSIFMFHSPKIKSCLPLARPSTPLVIDTNGVWFRSEGHQGNFICGVSPGVGDPDEDCVDEDCLRHADDNLFQDIIWPTLCNRVPVFEEIKMKSSWAGFYEINTLDEVKYNILYANVIKVSKLMHILLFLEWHSRAAHRL